MLGTVPGYITAMADTTLFPTADPTPPPFIPRQIISGGQTGVDRGALEAAIECGIGHGGCCPAGRLAEDGVIPAKYRLRELDSPHYPVRTAQNVQDADATLILYRGRISGGTRLTRRICHDCDSPCLVVKLDRPDKATETIRRWLAETRPEVLNVAGPRESNSPGLQDATCRLLVQVLGPPSSLTSPDQE